MLHITGWLCVYWCLFFFAISGTVNGTIALLFLSLGRWYFWSLSIGVDVLDAVT